MYSRALESTLKRFAKIYPIVGLTGPRQSGKTTLAKHVFSNFVYVSLEDPDTRMYATEDPRGFLQQYKNGAIFDEVQHVPDLLSYLQTIVDSEVFEDEAKYVITGSQNFAISNQISQSLSGRVGMLTLLPLSFSEISMHEEMENNIFRGGYPAIYQRNISPIDYFPSYINTYIERDVRQIKKIDNLGRFQNFLKLCAGRVGQVVNFSSLAMDAGISHTTAREWINILEASYIIFRIQPYYKNYSKRIIKMPKVYFYDTALLCNLLGIEKESQISNHYLKGSLYENMVILEAYKHRLNKGLPHNLYYWRDKTGHEIDLIIDGATSIKAIEIKSSITFNKEFLKNIDFFGKLEDNSDKYLIYNGKTQGEYKGTRVVSIHDIYKFDIF